MAKKITNIFRLQVPAGQANPAPPVGPALGQRGLNIPLFCKSVNEESIKRGIKTGTPLPIVITAYDDRSFTFEIKTPPASFLLKERANISAGSKTPGKANVGVVTRAHLREVAEIKMQDLNANNMDAACRIIEGSARSMGLKVTE